MTARDAAVWRFAALTVVAVTGLAGVLLACMRGKAAGSAAIIVTGASLPCGVYAGPGWAWFLATGMLR